MNPVFLRWPRTARRMMVRAASAALILVLTACGGGTIGTEPASFSGSVEGAGGRALEGATVTVLSSGDHGTTDANGNFQFETRFASTDEEILVAFGDFEGRATVTDIDLGATELKVRITVDDVRGIVNAVVVDAVEPLPPAGGGDEDEADRQEFLGMVKNRRGTAIAGVKIGIPSSRTETRSGTDGKIRLQTRGETGNVRFSVSYKGASGAFTLRNVPEGENVTVRFTLVLTVEEGQIDPGTGKPRKKLHLEVR